MVEHLGVARHSQDVSSIKDLICAELGAGRTVRQLEADSGDRVKFQTFQELSNNAPKQFPKDIKTIKGMAEALRVSETTVVLAYAKGLGIPVRADSSFALRLPPRVDHLDPGLQDAIIRLARAAVQAQEASTGDGKSPLRIRSRRPRPGEHGD